MSDILFSIMVSAIYVLGTPIAFTAWIWHDRPMFIFFIVVSIGMSMLAFKRMNTWNTGKRVFALCILNCCILSIVWILVPSQYKQYEIDAQKFIDSFPRPESSTVHSMIINPFAFEGVFFDQYSQGTTTMWITIPRSPIKDGNYQDRLKQNIIMGLGAASWEDISEKRRELEAFYRSALATDWDEIPQNSPELLSEYQELMDCKSGSIPTKLFLEGGKFSGKMGNDTTHPEKLTNHPILFVEKLNNIKFCECQKIGNVSWATRENRQYCAELPMSFKRKLNHSALKCRG